MFEASFDTLRTNDMGITVCAYAPFVVSLSNHGHSVSPFHEHRSPCSAR
jgi:hypothetical protein